jgi:hypothetical protein
MSQGKLNAIPPGVGGVAGELATSQITNQIAQQGQTSMQQTPPLGTMPGTFGRAGGSVQQPDLNQFGGIGTGFGMADPTGVNTPAPEDELDALPGPDSMGGGY